MRDEPRLRSALAAVLLIGGLLGGLLSREARAQTGDGRPEADEAWSQVAAARAGLVAASPLSAEFVQSYTPSGFSTADEESGRLSMNLSRSGQGTSECVRWDYEVPFPKGFLLCDRVAWSWNPGEASGRRQILARADSFGLDLLRLSLDQLRAGYEATVVASDESRTEIRLVPSGPAAAEIRDASLELDTVAGRLLALSYHDVEGNLTRFALGEYRPVADPGSIFTPPSELAWLEE